jgi:hypothetical protein
MYRSGGFLFGRRDVLVPGQNLQGLDVHVGALATRFIRNVPPEAVDVEARVVLRMDERLLP